MAFKDKPTKLTFEEVAKWELEDKFRRKVKSAKYECEEDGKEYEYQYVKPTREVIDVLSKYQDKPSKANELLLNLCVLSGDIEVLDWSDSVYYSLVRDIAELLDQQKKA